MTITNTQQKGEKNNTSLPSPPNSSFGDDKEEVVQLPENYTIEHTTHNTTTNTNSYKRTSPRRQRRRRRSSSLSSNHSNSSNNSNNTQNKERYRCRDCGKVYKHPNCLSKHQWEHSEEWEFTSKFLLTKHQQVQLLEAAAILMTMTNNNNNQQDDLQIIEDDDLL